MALVIIRKPKPAETSMLDDLKALDPPVVKEEPVPEKEVVAPQDLPWEEPAALELPEGSLSESQWGQLAAQPQTKDNNIQVALAYLSAQVDKPTLMLVRRATGECFQVLLHDPDTGETKLLDIATEREFKIRLREQENRFYRPLWR